MALLKAGILAALLLAGCNNQSANSFDGTNYRTEAEKVAHGKRLAVVLDCTGCHGSNMQGTDLNKDPKAPPVYAPNLTVLLAGYNDAELDRVIRQGVPKDGREFWFMPVESYQFLSNSDVAAIIAFLRTFKPAGKPLTFSKSDEFKKEIAQGLIGNSKAQISKYRDRPPIDLGPKYARGRLLAQMTCAQCHNNALQGWTNFTPDLDVAGTYSRAELNRLLTTGQGKVKKDLGMMTEIGRDHLSKLTPKEREEVIDYVLARANRPQ